jgi:hypothetical protein
MVRALSEIEYPPVLLARLKTFGEYFPDRVKWDAATYTVEVTEQMPLELRICISYLHLVCDIQDVMDNIELVLADLVSLSERPPQDPKNGERRYFLLTKLFFYELLRIRDAIPRFLKRFEEHGLMSKKERHATNKIIEQQLSEHYLIRNVYLHGHSLPKSGQEDDLSLISMLAKYGYEPKLVPLAGGEAKRYPELLQKLALKRRDALENIAGDMITFCQNIIDYTATWVHHHHFEKAQEVKT